MGIRDAGDDASASDGGALDGDVIVDGGVDAATHAGFDAGFDGGVDAGVDGGPACGISLGSCGSDALVSGALGCDSRCCGEELACVTDHCVPSCASTEALGMSVASGAEARFRLCASFERVGVLPPPDGELCPALWLVGVRQVSGFTGADAEFAIHSGTPDLSLPGSDIPLLPSLTVTPAAGRAFATPTFALSGGGRLAFSVGNGVNRDAELFVVELGDGSVRSIRGGSFTQATWLDDDVLLVRAAYADAWGGAYEPGVYAVNAGATELTMAPVLLNLVETGGIAAFPEANLLYLYAQSNVGGRTAGFMTPPLTVVTDIVYGGAEPVDLHAMGYPPLVDATRDPIFFVTADGRSIDFGVQGVQVAPIVGTTGSVVLGPEQRVLDNDTGDLVVSSVDIFAGLVIAQTYEAVEILAPAPAM